MRDLLARLKKFIKFLGYCWEEASLEEEEKRKARKIAAQFPKSEPSEDSDELSDEEIIQAFLMGMFPKGLGKK